MKLIDFQEFDKNVNNRSKRISYLDMSYAFLKKNVVSKGNLNSDIYLYNIFTIPKYLV